MMPSGSASVNDECLTIQIRSAASKSSVSLRKGSAPREREPLNYFGTTKKMTEHVEIKLKNKLSELERFNQSLAEFGRRQGLGSKVMHDLNLALEEILTNVISYGYMDDREHEIKVHLSTQPGAVNAEVEDDGRPFNPLEAPEPDTTKPLEERSIGGLGIQLVRKLTDGLEYKRQADRNLLTLTKKTEEV
jgi:serine/threonine-protein kinase RsbW